MTTQHMQHAFLKYGATILAGVFLTIGAMAFDGSGNDPKKKTDKKDTTVSAGIEDRGFKDLFTGEVNTDHPYTAQINPKAWSFVQDYLARYGKHLENMKSWAGPYFRMMDAILTSYGIPREMKYLAVIESNLKNTALSWAGAVGPWQFMPETGRRMGLRIDYRVDER
ncbi:MAG TPA: transglycosylase SLT domain-containing protein, partial [Gammaproteobacteria bacterium]|nr:transglycosylase SLT domain-containing protein [Gammaproteobacteria bacterium]